MPFEFKEKVSLAEQAAWLHQCYHDYERSYYGRVPMDEEISVNGWALDYFEGKKMDEVIFQEKP